MSASDTNFPHAVPATTFDPGLTQVYAGPLNRVVDRNGQFNVHRVGLRWRDANPYTYLISISWPRFMVIVTIAFVLANILFAGIYEVAGAAVIKGALAKTPFLTFLNLFFFSAHTLTTVGYGNMYPDGPTGNAIAAFEALLGLMTFAIATGILFGRFSRPTARFGFSANMVVAPYRDMTSLQFRLVNRRATSNLINVEARMMLMTVEIGLDGRPARRYAQLELERTNIFFLALMWTVVHPIDESSPLFGKTAEDLHNLQAEVVIMMRGYDETFGQDVHARYSYRFDEIRWGARFAKGFDVDHQGDMVLWVNKVGSTEPAALPEAQ